MSDPTTSLVALGNVADVPCFVLRPTRVWSASIGSGRLPLRGESFKLEASIIGLAAPTNYDMAGLALHLLVSEEPWVLCPMSAVERLVEQRAAEAAAQAALPAADDEEILEGEVVG